MDDNEEHQRGEGDVKRCAEAQNNDDGVGNQVARHRNQADDKGDDQDGHFKRQVNAEQRQNQVEVQAGQEGVDQRDFDLGEEHAFKAGFKIDDAPYQFGFKQRHFVAVFAHFQAVETEHGADDDADKDVHEGRDAVFTDTGQRGAVFFNQLDCRGFDFGHIVGQHIENGRRQVLAVFGVFQNCRQLRQHEADMAAVYQVVNAQRHHRDDAEHDGQRQRGGNQVDIVRVERFMQPRVARQNTAAEFEDHAVGARNKDIGQDNRQQQRQKMVVQDDQQSQTHQDIGGVAESRVVGV